MKRGNIVGIIFVILGVAICATGIGVHIAYLYQRYQGFAAYEYFDSFSHYYWTVGKANLAASIIFGILSAGIGLIFIEHQIMANKRLAANISEESPK